MRGAGGTDGGVGLFVVGLVLSALDAYWFFDSVLASTDSLGSTLQFDAIDDQVAGIQDDALAFR